MGAISGAPSGESAGVASPAHLAGAMLNVLAGVKGVHVPYKGAAPAMIDMIGGQIQYFITSPIVALPHGKAGRIKILRLPVQSAIR